MNQNMNTAKKMNDNKLPDFIVIDDDRVNNKLCRMVIQNVVPGIDIQTFFDPNAGLVHMRSVYEREEANNAILLLDINMPTLFGWEVLEEFKSFPDSVRQRFRIFMLSSSIDPHDKERADRNPLVSGYIEKPLTELKIKAILYHQKSIHLN